MTKKIKSKFNIGEIHPLTGKIKIAPNTWRNVDFNSMTKGQLKQFKDYKTQYTLKEIELGVYGGSKKNLSPTAKKTIALNIAERFIQAKMNNVDLFKKPTVNNERATYPYEVSDFLEDNPNFKEDKERENRQVERFKQHDKVKVSMKNDEKKVKMSKDMNTQNFLKLFNVVENLVQKKYNYEQLTYSIKTYVQMNMKPFLFSDLSKGQLLKLWEHYRTVSSKGSSRF